MLIPGPNSDLNPTCLNVKLPKKPHTHTHIYIYKLINPNSLSFHSASPAAPLTHSQVSPSSSVTANPQVRHRFVAYNPQSNPLSSMFTIYILLHERGFLVIYLFFNNFGFVNDIVGYCFLMIMFIVLNRIWIVDGLGLN